MAIALQTQPALRALLGGGQTQYIFYGDERIAAGGVAAQNRISLYTMADGERLTLTWNGQTIRLTAKNAPSGPYEFPAGVDSPAYREQVLPYLRDLYALHQDFIVELADTFPGYRLTARKAGEAYNFAAQTTSPLLLINPLVVGRTPLIRSRYSVQAALWVQDVDPNGTDETTPYSRIYETAIETDEAGTARFEVSPLLDGYVGAAYPSSRDARPDLPDHRRYYVEYAEAYGDPLQVGRVSRTDVRHIYPGGASVARRAGDGYSVDGFVRQPGRLDYGLRTGPLRRYVGPDSVQYLSFLNVGAALDRVVLQIDLVWPGGMAQQRTDLVAGYRFGDSTRLTYGVGPDQLGLLALMPTRPLVQYTVRLVNAATRQILSEPYTFVLDYAVRPYARQFAYVNSLGAVDTLTTWGKGSSEYTLFADLAQRALVSPYAADEGTYQVYQASFQDEISVTSGFRPQAELRTWRDFYRSAQKWLLKRPLQRGAADACIPVGLVSTSIQEGRDGTNLWAHQFALTPLRRELYYSPDDDALEEPPPPREFVPGGPVTVNVVTVVQARDPTISEAVRRITEQDITGLRRVMAFGDPNQKGFLKQAATDQLYRAKSDAVLITDIADFSSTLYTRTETDVRERDLMRRIIDQVRVRVRAVPANFSPA